MARAAARLPRVDLHDLSGLNRALHEHGYAILNCSSNSELLALLGRADAAASAFFDAPPPAKQRVRVAQYNCASTRRHARCSRLPLNGVGWNAVREHGRLKREQLHLVADAAAMALVPWPAGQPLRACMVDACAAMRALCVRLLRALELGDELARALDDECAARGDASVLDAFRYPAGADAGGDDGADFNMRSHTDPGLLTITLASAVAGLQIRDGGAWVDAEAKCSAGEALVFCGEALQIATAGRYRAAPHRVRCARKVRHSLVFELRATFAHPLASAEAPRRSAAADDDDAPAAAAEAEARSYVDSFVRERLRRGSTFAQVLGEFSVPPDFARPPADADALVTLLIDWVRCCEERDEARAALEAAEHVVFTPSFGDCTGMYVDVHVPRPGS